MTRQRTRLLAGYADGFRDGHAEGLQEASSTTGAGSRSTARLLACQTGR